jgi:hypothetical protein
VREWNFRTLRRFFFDRGEIGIEQDFFIESDADTDPEKQLNLRVIISP